MCWEKIIQVLSVGKSHRSDSCWRSSRKSQAPEVKHWPEEPLEESKEPQRLWNHLNDSNFLEEFVFLKKWEVQLLCSGKNKQNSPKKPPRKQNPNPPLNEKSTELNPGENPRGVNIPAHFEGPFLEMPVKQPGTWTEAMKEGQSTFRTWQPMTQPAVRQQKPEAQESNLHCTK